MKTTTQWKAMPCTQKSLNDLGFVHIPYTQFNSLEETLKLFGEVIYTTEIKENPNSTRLLASHQKMDFHTDHFAAKYIAWFCNSQSAVGGESLLIDIQPILQNYSEEELSILKEITVQSHAVFYNDKTTLPIVQLIRDELAIFYAAWLVNQPVKASHQLMVQRFKEDVARATPSELKLSEGDLLIINNHRMLHGRNAFQAQSNRWLTRYWIK